MVRRALAGFLVVAVTLFVSFMAQSRMNALKDEELELLYLPNERLLTHFTAGMSAVIADLLWLRTIDYTVKEFHNEERKFTWLEHMVNTVTRLDPYYEGAYRYGGMLLAGIGADEEALKLLKRGAILNPYSEAIPFEIVQVYLLNRYQDPATPAVATRYLRMVAERSEHAQFYLDWIHRIQRKEDFGDMARDLWEDLLRETDDPFMRELAESKLLDLTIRTNVEALAAAVEHYESETGNAAKSLDELITAGYLSGLPGDQKQGRYFLDADGEVKNTVLLDHDVERIERVLNAEVARYKQSELRFPATLQEWAEWTGLEEPPRHPYANRQWRYNPATGEVSGS